MTATAFKFSSFKIDFSKKKIFFNYEIKFGPTKKEVFTEELIFPETLDFKKIPKELLNNFATDLHIALGLSYYKLYVPKKFEYGYKLSAEQAKFFNTIYHKGLGEFCWRNKIKFKDLAVFKGSAKIKRKPFDLNLQESSLVGIGGGKDSIVALELLKKERIPITGFILETNKDLLVAREVAKVAGVSTLIIERKLDPKVFQVWPNSYNGHIPISAIIAFIGSLAAVLAGQKYFVVANEQSSNFGNVNYDGEEVNHQWSKSGEFEAMFQTYLEGELVSNLKYFSPIRPYYEIRVVEVFSKFEKYFPIFTSCNRNYRIHFERPGGRWCGECPKCAFMFVLLGAFLDKKGVVDIFSKNMLEDENLLPLFRDLLGLGTMKPFDCVGTFDEMQVAFELLSKKFADTIIVKKLLSEVKPSDETKKEVFKYHEASNLPERFKFFGVKNALILGYALEGEENEKFLKDYYPEIKRGIADAKDGSNYLLGQENYDLGIKTAGMPRGLVKIPYTTGTNIFLSHNKNLVIGVTGSKGKSTTASLIYEILKEGGRKVKLLGNIGKPMLHYLAEAKDEEEILVIELSSYQLEDIKFSPQIAVVTNLFPEHLDYHGGLTNYYEAKKNILKYQTSKDWFIYNGQVKDFKNWAKEAKGKKLAVAGGLKIKSGETALLGKHNKSNINLAVAVAKLFKIPEAKIRLVIKNFKPLPHRLELVGEYQGLKFYDDAISTAPESTILAIQALGKVGTIFLGGTDRGYDFSQLEKEIKKQKIKNVVLFPESGKRMFKRCDSLNILETSSMEEAVKFAYQFTKPGEIVLLSTASPSYGLWKNFEEKGNEFKKYVLKFAK